jgi:hypothetical protein
MTHQEREQKAREWLISRGFCHKTLYDIPPYKLDVDSLVALLADTERATLERVAETHLLSCAFLNDETGTEQEPCSCDMNEFRMELRQQAKEIPS